MSIFWEKIQPLNPLKPEYLERFPNIQAALGLDGLERLDEWTRTTQAHAHAIDRVLRSTSGIQTPSRAKRSDARLLSVLRVRADRDELVIRCIRRGVDIETLHVDVCPQLPLFADLSPAPAPNAERASEAVQVPSTRR